MSRGINKVILVGHLGQDPQQRAMPNGNAVANFSVATTEKWKDRQSGEAKEITEWHRCVAFGKLAEIICQYARKGSQAFVAGKLRTRKWEKDGIERYSTEIICDEFLLVGGRREAQPAAAPASSGQRGADVRPPDEPAGSGTQTEAFDDDIPF